MVITVRPNASGRYLLFAAAVSMTVRPALAEEPARAYHPLGFSVPVPAGAMVETDGDGFLLHLDGSLAVRSPATVEVSLHHAPEPPPTFALDLSAQVGGTTAQYGLHEATEGSGGTEYTLVVRRPLCGGVLEVRADEQHEYGGTLQFEDAWRIVEEARCAD